MKNVKSIFSQLGKKRTIALSLQTARIYNKMLQICNSININMIQLISVEIFFSPLAWCLNSIYFCTYFFFSFVQMRRRDNMHLPRVIILLPNYINRIQTRYPIIVTIYYCKCYLHMYLSFKQFHKVFLFSFVSVSMMDRRWMVWLRLFSSIV